ncbi:MAG: TetR family transcriptional regulator [Clostridia bacterium]|nr:TetR family transcriptional regulator [Clostridia bacterium]
MKQKQQQKSYATREKILTAAEAEFAEKGFYGARVDAIAEASGVNKRMIYAHFESKEKLYSRVLLAVYERFADLDESFMTEDESPIACIRNIVIGSFQSLAESPHLVRSLMWANLMRGNLMPKSDLAKVKAPGIEYIKKQIARGKEMGVFKPDADEYQTVLSLMNFCFSYFSNLHTMSAILETDMNTAEQINKRAEYITSIILEYLCI